MNRKWGLRNALVLIGLMVVVLSASLSFGGTGSSTNLLVHNEWKNGKHSQTQKDVAKELAGSHAGETPQGVIQGENCIACHGPTAVLANGGMTEGQTLGYFFSTKNGKFTTKTWPIRTAQWPGSAVMPATTRKTRVNPPTSTQPRSNTKRFRIQASFAADVTVISGSRTPTI